MGHSQRVHVGVVWVGTGMDVNVRAGIATRASLLWDQGDRSALLIEILTPLGKDVCV